MFAMTCARMHYQTRRFVQHDHILIFEQYVERNGLRQDVCLLNRRFGDSNNVTGADRLPGPRWLAVEGDGTGPDQLLEAGAGELREVHCQETINPLATRLCRHG